jgi:hypothetical protein
MSKLYDEQTLSFVPALMVVHSVALEYGHLLVITTTMSWILLQHQTLRPSHHLNVHTCSKERVLARV